MNGITRTVDDVWFRFDNTNSVDTRPYTFNPDTLLLPELRGYGDVSSMSIALSKDATLLTQMQTIASADLDTLFSAAFNLEGKMTALMLRWAGADSVTPGSRGAYFDAQKLVFLEKILGTPYSQQGSSNPLGGAVTPILQQAWDTAYNAIVARVLFQSAGHQVFSTAPVYNYATDSFSGS